jgi:hypothetical protein
VNAIHARMLFVVRLNPNKLYQLSLMSSITSSIASCLARFVRGRHFAIPQLLAFQFILKYSISFGSSDTEVYLILGRIRRPRACPQSDPHSR